VCGGGGDFSRMFLSAKTTYAAFHHTSLYCHFLSQSHHINTYLHFTNNKCLYWMRWTNNFCTLQNSNSYHNRWRTYQYRSHSNIFLSWGPSDANAPASTHFLSGNEMWHPISTIFSYTMWWSTPSFWSNQTPNLSCARNFTNSYQNLMWLIGFLPPLLCTITQSTHKLTILCINW
jgi:hypothetical protein